MLFRVLGPLEVIDRSADLTPSAPKVRQVLSLLLLCNNQPVHTNELIDELWGERAPRSALSTLQTYIYKLRKVLGDERSPSGGETLRTKPYGYVLSIPRESLDQHLFQRLVTEGAAALEAGDAETAADRLQRGFRLWRGRALSDIVAGEPLAARLTSLEESRLRALELFSDAKLRLGRHAELISDLKTLTAENPLHEGFHTRLMITLYRAGRRTEALDVYHKLRRVLCDDLGLDPSPVVDRTYQALISSDPALEADFPAAGTGAVTLRGLGSPAQLPPDIGDFAGHERLLERAERWLTGSDHRTAVPVLAVSGMPGIGKTAFALRLAHRLAPSFPDGQLYHRLREPDGTQTSSAAVLTSFLRGAGLSTEDIPDGVDELQKAFRTWCSGRSLLLVLDDAVSVRQILPLLPGYARCAVVITSRERLHAVPGARTVTLSPLSLQQGSELLAQLIGRDRFRATPEMSETVVRLCAGNPSALRCAGAAIAARNWSTATYARRLAESRSRLDEFAMGDEDLRSRFAASFRTLDAGEQLVFTTVAGLAGPEFTAAQIAEAARLSPDIADLILLKLVDRNLVDTVPGGPPPRYAMPELLRLYAAELAAAPEGEAPGDRHVLMLGGLSRRAHLGV